MGKIMLKNMRFFGYHGVLEEEKKLGQEFQIDVELNIDLDKVIKTDNVEDTIDYSKVYHIARNIVENEKFNLIETLAGHILNDVKNTFESRIIDIVVRVRKPSAPINGIFDYAEIELKG